MEVKEFRIACGAFIGIGDLDRNEWERPGTALVPRGIPYAEGIFAVRARGHSMEPRIRNRMWCLFHPDVVGTRQDRVVLVEDQSKIGGNCYTLKKYHSRKVFSLDGTWKHSEILLLPLNSEHEPIRLEEEGTYRVRGWFVGAVSRLQRVKPLRYRRVVGE